MTTFCSTVSAYDVHLQIIISLIKLDILWMIDRPVLLAWVLRLHFRKTEFADLWPYFVFLRLNILVHNKNVLEKIGSQTERISQRLSILQISTHVLALIIWWCDSRLYEILTSNCYNVIDFSYSRMCDIVYFMESRTLFWGEGGGDNWITQTEKIMNWPKPKQTFRKTLKKRFLIWKT